MQCSMCKRETFACDDPPMVHNSLAIDCGGDCWGCIGEIEALAGFVPSIITVKREMELGVRPANAALEAAYQEAWNEYAVPVERQFPNIKQESYAHVMDMLKDGNGADLLLNGDGHTQRVSHEAIVLYFLRAPREVQSIIRCGRYLKPGAPAND